MQVRDRITKLFSKVKESAFISSKYNVVSITALSKNESDILFAQTSSNTQSDSQISTSTPKTRNDKKPLDSKESKFVEHVILRAPNASTIIIYTLMSFIFAVNTGTFALTDCSLTELETSTTGGEGNENAMELVVQEFRLRLAEEKLELMTTTTVWSSCHLAHT